MSTEANIEKKYDLSQLVEAVAITAERIGAACDKDVLWKTLTVLKEPFEAGGTAYRTTTQLPRSINVRYMNPWIPDYPFEIAVKNGLIKDNGHPCMKVLPTAMEYFQLGRKGSGFSGVDVGAAYGLEKIWLFFKNSSVPLRQALAMPGLPSSIGAYVDYFEKYQLDKVSLFGVDFRSKTINVYFMAWEIGGLSPTKAAGMLSDLGFTVPSDEVLQHCGRAIPLYYTFDWESPNVQRLCFGCYAPEPSLVPKWAPLMEQFVADAQIFSEKRLFYYNPTFGPDGKDYFKVEAAFHESYATALTVLIPKSYLETLQSH